MQPSHLVMVPRAPEYLLYDACTLILPGLAPGQHSNRPTVLALMQLSLMPEPLLLPQGFRQRLEGMVHISNLSKRPVGSAKDVVKRGQEVWVKVRDGGVKCDPVGKVQV